MITLPYPQRRGEIIKFVKKHHYSRRCPGVYSVAYAIENSRGAIQAVAVYGPPPYPNIARAFVRCPEHTPKVTWQTRLVGAGITGDDLDQLLSYANADLLTRGFWWVTTLTDPVSKVIDGALMKLLMKGYAGEVYQRNHWLYLGTSGAKKLEGFVIDGQPVHVRQGATTLTLANVRDHFPRASNIRTIYGNQKQRWASILAATDREYADRLLLMKYRVQPYEQVIQPRLLWNLGGLLCTPNASPS